MRNATGNKPSRITRGSVFADLGFAPEKAMALTFRAQIVSTILAHVRRKRYTQSQLVDLLDEHQPVVSNLMRGKISHMSIEKLLTYADRLGLRFELQPSRPRRRRRAA